VRWRPNIPGDRVIAPGASLRRLLIVVAVWLSAGVAVVWASVALPAAAGSAFRQFTGNGELVILEPGTWIGKRFPLLPEIDIGERLSDGEWTALLYHHDCPECLQTIDRCNQIAAAASGSEIGITVIEIAPYADAARLPVHPRILRGRLSNDREWFVPTPVVVSLADGVVTDVAGSISGQNREK